MHIRPRLLLLGSIALLALAGVIDIAWTAYGQRSANIHVRWAASVDDARRKDVEKAYGLQPLEFREQRTWSYRLTDVSRANIRNLVRDPDVEDTHYLDRRWFRVARAAERGAYPGNRPAWIGDLLEFGVDASLFLGVVALFVGAFTAWRSRSTRATRTDDARVAWRDGVFVAILLTALALRLFLAMTEPYIHDEDNTAIPLSRAISFDPAHLNLPLRGENHGALPAYVVKASGALFGASPLGYRSLHIALGLATILLVYLLTRDTFGIVAARWASAFMAFNEYHLTLSSRASAQAPYLFFVAAAVYGFSRFLATDRARYLYLTAAAIGLAFYCKEHALLLVPVFSAVLLRRDYRRWFVSRHAYLACAVLLLVIGPDLLWNARTDPDAARVTYGGKTLGQATYSTHLQRIGGIGLSPYPLVFYASGPTTALHRTLMGSELGNVSIEYRSVNAGLGLLLLGSVVLTTFRRREHGPVQALLLAMAWGIFGFFTLIQRGDPPFRLSPVSWVWVEATLVPTVILAGVLVAAGRPRWRTALWLYSGLVLLYAIHSVVLRPTG
jgi:4-amino-4-deoxy-L-arabinose transferase-like glycosyltransferase